ncbi:MAG: hypothetical protein AAF456_15630 [Planctomycetota bacterium]
MRGQCSTDTRVSGYDRFNATLLSLILIGSFFVLILAMVYFSSLTKPVAHAFTATPVTTVTTCIEQDLPADSVATPDRNEFPTETVDLLTIIDHTTEAVSTVSASGTQEGLAEGAGGQEEERSVPAGREEPEIIPDYRRWVVDYHEDDLAIYAAQLDHLGIILGVVRLSENEIVLIEDISETASSRITTRRDMSDWLRFEHRKPAMRRWDSRLVERAGVSLSDSAVVQFFPDELRVHMSEIEAALLDSRDISLEQVQRTFFKIETDESGVRIVVSDIVLRQ